MVEKGAGGIAMVCATHARDVFVNVPGFSVAAVNCRQPTPSAADVVEFADFVMHDWV
jgi:hypothetical protein